MAVKLAIKVAQRKRGRLNFRQRKAKRVTKNRRNNRAANLRAIRSARIDWYEAGAERVDGMIEEAKYLKHFIDEWFPAHPAHQKLNAATSLSRRSRARLKKELIKDAQTDADEYYRDMMGAYDF